MKTLWSVVIFALVLTVFSSVGMASAFSVDSLKHQIESGVLVEDITCKDTHVLVLRTSGSPACVTETTANKIGWEIIKTEFETIKLFQIDPNPSNVKQTTSLYDDTVTVLVKLGGEYTAKDKPFGAYSESRAEQRAPSPNTFEELEQISANPDRILEIIDGHIMQEQIANDLDIDTQSLDPENHRGFIISEWVPTEIPSGYELKLATWSGPFEGPISFLERLNIDYAPTNVLLTPQNYTTAVYDVQGFVVGGHYFVSEPLTDDKVQHEIDRRLGFGEWEETTILGKRAVVLNSPVTDRVAIDLYTNDYDFGITSYYHTLAELTDILKSIPALQ